MVANSAVGDLPLVIEVTLDGRDFLAAWRESRAVIAIAVALVILAMAGAAYVVFRQLGRTEQNETELREAIVAAEEANDAKSRFLAHMSHEFRTPLNAIMGFSEIIRDKIFGGTVAPEYTSYADHIHRSGAHLLQIVNDILDMAKIESGVETIRTQPVDIHGTIKAAIAFVEGLARQKNMRILVDVPTGTMAASGDERFSRQVLINLLSNAIKFSPAGSEVTVAMHTDKNGALDIDVRDNGIGIEPEILRRVGEPFLQGNPNLSQSGQGTGLGLSICKRYMTLLGGELVLESTVGRGTTATIRFPAILWDKPAPPSSQARSSSWSDSNIRITGRRLWLANVRIIRTTNYL